RLYGVNAMTVRADRRLRNAPRGCLTVNALDEVAHHLRMAFGAGLRDVGLEDSRQIIRCGQDVVAVMAIGADGCADLAARDGAGVRALLISEEREAADARPIHDGIVAVTGATRPSDVGPVYGRCR